MNYTDTFEYIRNGHPVIIKLFTNDKNYKLIQMTYREQALQTYHVKHWYEQSEEWCKLVDETKERQKNKQNNIDNYLNL